MTEAEKVIGILEEENSKLPEIHFGRDRRPTQRLGQGVHRGVFYYGCQTQKGEIALVTSEGRFFVKHTTFEKDEKGKTTSTIEDGIKRFFGLNYQHGFDEDSVEYPWKQTAILKYIRKSYSPINLIELFENILKINQEFIEHHDDVAHQYIACYTIATYCYTLFDSFGRLYYNAERGSGKSKQSRLNKLMCFNSMWITKGSESSTIRSLESTCGTAIIDNYDKLHDDTKKAIDHLFETGLYSDAKYRLTNKNTMKQEAFRAYSGLILNNIVNLDENTIDKCLEIKMMKTTSNKARKHPDTKNPIFEQIRNQCRLYVLDNWKTIEKTYNTLDIPNVDGRFLDVIKGTLTIAKMLGDGVYSDIVNFCKEKEREMSIKTLDGDWKYTLFNDILEQSQGKDFWLSIKKTSSRITPDLEPIREYRDRNGNLNFDEADQKKKQNKVSRWIGKTLRNIACFRKTRVLHGETLFFIKNNDLTKYMTLQGFDDTPIDSENTEKEQTDHPTPPTPPKTPTPPHNTQKGVTKGALGGEKVEGDVKFQMSEKLQKWKNDPTNAKNEVHHDFLTGVYKFTDEEIQKLKKEGQIHESTPGGFCLT